MSVKRLSYDILINLFHLILTLLVSSTTTKRVLSKGRKKNYKDSFVSNKFHANDLLICF